MSNNDFAREDRYLVFKRSDIEASLNTLEKETLLMLSQKVFLRRQVNGKIPLECVVVESDWPNYSEVWKSVESVANGTYQPAELVINNLQSNYGDNWYDGFMAAKEISKTQDLDDYNDANILSMSEHAENDWLEKNIKVANE
ncbi:hypothetical protein CRN61_17680 [Vibrio vulnificus]|uniref:hypothetical protein n=1 Tax=Vibrio vulnificus TaxID=672 RepID=UPI000C9E6BE5|nr:hypothetical protein [Vibrio vulnificus]POC08161.1 hypothetical protein CRN54_16720 [Vibrio vulnificus]POC78022.1 hypothetical protein CRN61_17680 [Vibrio vulnificus]